MQIDPADFARRQKMKVVKRSITDPEDDSDILAMTPSERVALVHELRNWGYVFLAKQLGFGARLPRHAWPVVKASR